MRLDTKSEEIGPTTAVLRLGRLIPAPRLVQLPLQLPVLSRRSSQFLLRAFTFHPKLVLAPSLVPDTLLLTLFRLQPPDLC